SLLAVHHDAQFPVVSRRESPVRILRHHAFHFRTQCDANAIYGGSLLRADVFRPLGEDPTVFSRSSRARFLDEPGSDEEIDLYILPGLMFLDEIPTPCRKMFDPTGNGVMPSSNQGHRERRTPTVVSEQLHRDIGPVLGRPRAIPKNNRERIVSVGEGIGLNYNLFANCPLNRESSSFDFRSASLNGVSLLATIIFHEIRHSSPPQDASRYGSAHHLFFLASAAAPAPPSRCCVPPNPPQWPMPTRSLRI